MKTLINVQSYDPSAYETILRMEPACITYRSFFDCYC